MSKYLLTLCVVLLLSCSNTELEVGGCKEYTTTLQCSKDQIAANRTMINVCVSRGNGYSTCVNNLDDIGCIRETFVVCRQSENEFISYTNKSEEIQGDHNTERLVPTTSKITSTLPDTTKQETSKYDWYDKGEN